MSELIKATVQVRQVKKGPQAYITWTTKKGRQQEGNLSQDNPNLSRELVAILKGEGPEALQGREVEFILDGGQPKQIRPAGEHYQAPAQPRKSPGRGNNSGSPHNEADTFDNPYNFIPALNRQGVIDHPDLGDGLPPGHHRYHADHWSGKITVTLTNKTPLLIPGPPQDDTAEHKQYATRHGADGAPYLPPTSVKGMLRTAFEAVTNSRLGVFAGHDTPLAYRMKPDDSLRLVPARIISHDTDLRAQLLTGHSAMSPDGSPRKCNPDDRPGNAGNGVLLHYAAWLPRYEKLAKNAKDKGERQSALKYPDGSLPAHQHRVFVRLIGRHKKMWDQKNQREKIIYEYYKVADIKRADDNSQTPPGWHQGWVCITGANIKNKYNERVFLLPEKPVDLPIPDPVRNGWRELVSEYQALHTDGIKKRHDNRQGPEDYLGDEPGKTAYSRHVYTPDCEPLRAGELCYAQVEQQDGQFQLQALFPVSISRRLFAASPAQLLPGSLHPADSIDQLSPADRVFGWVKGDGADTAGPDSPTAWKGKLRIGTAVCAQGEEAIVPVGGEQGLPLANLAQPKPQQARFYLARDKQGSPLDKGCEKNQRTMYLETQGLRGRKVYPHQPQTDLPDYWATDHAEPVAPLKQELNNKPVYREYRRMDGEQDSQNRTITDWVKENCEFTFTLDVTNLTAFELGALLWLLTLNQTPGGKPRYLRLGGGKPLGFGSVTLGVTDVDLRDGEALRDDYRYLSQRGTGGRRMASVEALDQPIKNGQSAVDYFNTVVGKHYGASGATRFNAVTFIAAFLHACEGGDLPVHYPRTQTAANPAGENFKWFVENEQRNHRWPLPSLAESTAGLPILETRNKNKSSR